MELATTRLRPEKEQVSREKNARMVTLKTAQVKGYTNPKAILRAFRAVITALGKQSCLTAPMLSPHHHQIGTFVNELIYLAPFYRHQSAVRGLENWCHETYLQEDDGCGT